ncbi:MAG: hypothetical protein ACK4K0_12580 [Flavobacteriales bacterium]
MNKYLSLFVGLVLFACASPDEKIQRQTLETILAEYEECKLNSQSVGACKNFVSRAICEYNGITDFIKDGEYVDYHEVFEIVVDKWKWKTLGYATNQEVLIEAQELANKGIAVVAINTNDKHKLPVLITTGELIKSTKWKLDVPNCAAFFPFNGPPSFISKSLNYAWSKPDGVKIYARKG